LKYPWPLRAALTQLGEEVVLLVDATSALRTLGEHTNHPDGRGDIVEFRTATGTLATIASMTAMGIPSQPAVCKYTL
jgi:hypothetical protein